ncbi:hypothetical protein [Methanosarcina horonobensis]|nr:hypothetical protein [Methanosarcina horonobensis]
MLCVAFSDIDYLNGSIYHVLARSQLLIIAMTLCRFQSWLWASLTGKSTA